MIDQIKNYYHIKIKGNIKDTRLIGLAVFLVIVLLVTWSGLKTVQTNYGLQKQLAKIQQQNQVQKLKNQNLALQNNYYNTNQFLELSARQNLGLAEQGETEIIIPKGVALKQLIALPGESINAENVAVVNKSYWQNNFQSWTNFFMHR